MMAIEIITDANTGEVTEREYTPDPVDIEKLRAQAVLNRMTFALHAAKAGYVTFDGAAQWAAGNSVPAPLQDALDALPEEQRGPAMVEVLASPNIRRNAPLMPVIIQAFGTDDAGADALFGIEVQDDV